ncbi:hypothetical protein K438DRAFT_1757738 [Mycena galopus ATCC 62051]|nr:hypothetical protein K438DRAFT_1757738 [Mycena galopus ATCC 62051]
MCALRMATVGLAVLVCVSLGSIHHRRDLVERIGERARHPDADTYTGLAPRSGSTRRRKERCAPMSPSGMFSRSTHLHLDPELGYCSSDWLYLRTKIARIIPVLYPMTFANNSRSFDVRKCVLSGCCGLHEARRLVSSSLPTDSLLLFNRNAQPSETY